MPSKTSIVFALLLIPFFCSLLVAEELPDGLNLDNIDAVVRVRNNTGSGTGSVYDETETHYKIVTNFHVAGKTGNRNKLDIWNDGAIAAKIESAVTHHYFVGRGLNKDISLLEVPKSSLPGPLPVIPMAEYQSGSLKVGDRVWQIGCDAGNWTNAERGVVLAIDQGVIFYLPNSIPGNSGGPLYSADCSKQVGVTTWVGPMQIGGKRYAAVGMAQSYDRFWDIVEGRVNSDAKIPTSAKDIPLGPIIKDTDVLPVQSKEVPMARVVQDSQVQQCDPIRGCPPFQATPTPVNPDSIASDPIQSRWRSPGDCQDGRLDPRGGEPEGDRKGKGPLGLGIFDGSVIAMVADFISWMKRIAVIAGLLFMFVIVNQILGPGWLIGLFRLIISGVGKVWSSILSSVKAPFEESEESKQERAAFEEFKRQTQQELGN